VLEGIFWIARAGVAWPDLDEHFGKWSSVYRQFRRRTLSDLWDVVLEVFDDSGGGNPSLQMIDSPCADGDPSATQNNTIHINKMPLSSTGC